MGVCARSWGEWGIREAGWAGQEGPGSPVGSNGPGEGLPSFFLFLLCFLFYFSFSVYILGSNYFSFVKHKTKKK